MKRKRSGREEKRLKSQEDNEVRNKRAPNTLHQLQSLVKTDKDSYVAEFDQQHRHFYACLDVFRLRPSQYWDNFAKLVLFLAQVSHCYPAELEKYPQQLMDLLRRYSTVLDRDMRSTLCRALIHIRNKGLITPNVLLELFFRLLSCPDKELRRFLREHIVADIRSINRYSKRHKLNTNLQNFMSDVLRDAHPVTAKTALDILITLYHRDVWNDTRTVNVIATSLFSRETVLVIKGVRFFLGHRKRKDQENESGDEDDAEEKKEAPDKTVPTLLDIVRKNRINKKTRHRERKRKKATVEVDKYRKSKKNNDELVATFAPLHLVDDPNMIAERLLQRISKGHDRYVVKLLIIDLVSRLIGVHRLFLFNFYPLVQRYLQSKQPEVTRLLLFAAQATHELIPPDVIEPLLMTIANNFVTDRNNGDVIAVGINAIREICIRQPLAMTVPLFHDLCQYKRSKQRSVSAAAVSLISLFRLVNPSIIRRKDKARPTAASIEQRVLNYGEPAAVDYIPGAEVLAVESAEDVEADDDEEVPGRKPKPSLVEQIQMAAEVSQNRILTQEEFREIRVNQICKRLRAAPPKGSNRRKKRKVDVVEDTRLLFGSDEEPEDPYERKELPTLADVEMIEGSRKQSREQRLQQSIEKRLTKTRSGGRKKIDPFASTRNDEKRKLKPIMMMVHKPKASLRHQLQRVKGKGKHFIGRKKGYIAKAAKLRERLMNHKLK